MAKSKRREARRTGPDRWPHVIIVPGLLLLAAILATTSLVGDSITFDETSHLTAGVSYLRTGDFRLTPEHPPLAEIWAGLPVFYSSYRWPPPEASGWREGNYWLFGRTFLFDYNNGEKLILAPRCMMVVLLLATCLCVYVVGRRLFGPPAGLLALTLAVLSPTLLAHGRLVTTDMPATLCFMVTLLTFARLAKSITWRRLLPAMLSFAALTLTKFSWPLIIPALVLMVAVVTLRSRAYQSFIFRRLARRSGEKEDGIVQIRGRLARLLAVAFVVGFVGATTWISIWSCFGWHYGALHDGNGKVEATREADFRTPSQPTRPMDWQYVLLDAKGKPARGLVLTFVRWARARRLLPEAYLYGLADTSRSAEARPTYLRGEYSLTGWRSYFPLAFIIKTPVPTMLLLFGGLMAIVSGRISRSRDVALLIGLGVFAITYAATAVTSHFNIGHRHLLPIYPVVMVLAGASTAWLNSRPGRWLIGGAVVWLLVANLWIHPHYLAYFNELVGGPSQGHRYLADSNIDWGQDVKRLAKYARGHPDEKIKLAYFGSGDPRRYGFPCEMLPSFLRLGEPASLTGGTYVVSVTQLLGVYDPRVRDSFWTRKNLALLRRLHDAVSRSTLPHETAEMRRRSLNMLHEYDRLCRARLLNRLRHRPPDHRIGYSLFVYRLTQSDVDALCKPSSENRTPRN